jgi:hypothetical protein
MIGEGIGAHKGEFAAMTAFSIGFFCGLLLFPRANLFNRLSLWKVAGSFIRLKIHSGGL